MWSAFYCTLECECLQLQTIYGDKPYKQHVIVFYIFLFNKNLLKLTLDVA